MRNFGPKCCSNGRSRIGVLLAITVVIIVAFAYSPTPEVASDTRKPDSCKLIPIHADDWPGMMNRRSLCERQASLPPDKYHYGALPPQTDAETRDVITLPGYPLPDVRAVSANEIETGYFSFIWQLARGEAATNSRGTSANDGAIDTSAAVAAARTKFLTRVAALPSYP